MPEKLVDEGFPEFLSEFGFYWFEGVIGRKPEV